MFFFLWSYFLTQWPQKGLKHLALRDLLLNIDEAKHLLDDVAENCYEQLISLTLINCCKFRHSFLHAGIFINLKTLVITCQVNYLLSFSLPRISNSFLLD